MLRAVFVQMAGSSVVDVPRCDKLVRAVRLMAFVTTANEERAGFVLLKARATNDGGYLLGEETSDGGAWGENDHTSAVNEDLGVSTHSERSPCHSLRRGIVEGSSVRIYEHRCEGNIASQLSGEIPSRSAVSKRW